jgi:hypothetical protein
VSIVDTDFGGPAMNFVADGTKERCESLKERLEKK